MKRFIVVWGLLGLFLTGCHSDKNSRIETKELDVSVLLLQNPTIKPVVVVGGGVAGLTAANYLLQANIPCLLLEGIKPGGALAQSDSVRNWPGIFEAPGLHITNSLKDQVVRNGGVISSVSLVKITKNQQLFNLHVRNDAGNEQEIQTLACIIAMGAEPNYLEIPGERGPEGYWGRGISNCAVCDGALFKDKTVAVVGGGDSAILEGAYLAGLAKQVYVLVRRNVLRARDVRKVTVVRSLSNVKFMHDVAVAAVHGDGKIVTHIDVLDNKTKKISKLNVDGLFLAIGAKPNSKLFAGLVELDSAGYIVLHKGQESSLPGLFAAGDICDPTTKQAVTSSAMGCKAALEVKDYLENLGYIPGGKGTCNATTSIANKDQVIGQKNHESVVEITSISLAKRILNSAGDNLAVVDVYGTFCMPCQKMAPVVEAVSRQHKDVYFAKLNIADRVISIEAFAQMVGTEQIMHVPTFLFIKGGKVIRRYTGMMSQDAFVSLVVKNK